MPNLDSAVPLAGLRLVDCRQVEDRGNERRIVGTLYIDAMMGNNAQHASSNIARNEAARSTRTSTYRPRRSRPGDAELGLGGAACHR